MKVELRNLQRDTRSLDGIVTMKKAGMMGLDGVGVGLDILGFKC